MRFSFAECELDTDTRVLTRNGIPAPTEPQVFDLLHLLLENDGRLVTRDEIIEMVWDGRIVSDSAISARIATARRAVGDDGKAQAIIATVPRRGLRLVCPVTRCSPPPHPEDTRDTAAPRIRYTRNPSGHSVAYATIGDGPPLIRVGHMATDLEAEWNVAAERACFGELARDNKLIRFDFSGTGRSERLPGIAPLETCAEDVIAVANAAGADRFSVISESGGVLAAIHLAAAHPDRVDRMIIVGGYAEGRVRRGQVAAGEEPLRAMTAASWDTPGSPIATALILAYFPEGPIEVAREFLAVMQASSDPAFELARRDQINNSSVLSLLPDVRCPTLVIHSRGDGVHPLSEAQRLAADIPDAELLVLETANHIPIHGHPVFETYIEAIREFLSRPG